MVGFAPRKMKCLCWNVWGLGNPRTFRALKKLTASEDLDLVFLSETKLCVNRLEWVRVHLKMERCIGVNRVGLGGGLALLWKKKVIVNLFSKSTGHIDTFVEMLGLNGFFFTRFYGNPDTSM